MLGVDRSIGVKQPKVHVRVFVGFDRDAAPLETPGRDVVVGVLGFGRVAVVTLPVHAIRPPDEPVRGQVVRHFQRMRVTVAWNRIRLNRINKAVGLRPGKAMADLDVHLVLVRAEHRFLRVREKADDQIGVQVFQGRTDIPAIFAETQRFRPFEKRAAPDAIDLLQPHVQPAVRVHPHAIGRVIIFSRRRRALEHIPVPSGKPHLTRGNQIQRAIVEPNGAVGVRR